MKALIEQAILEFDISGKDDTIRVDFDEEMGKVNIDSGKIKRLLVSVLNNAVKFSPHGSVIEVEARRNGDEVLVSVLDRGAGIPEEERERVFEQFYQVGEARHHSIPGIGLGLYIAKQIVDAHHGRIWCEPREGGGSIVRFSLPV